MHFILKLYTVCVHLHILQVTDILVYGVLVPVLGAFCGSAAARMLDAEGPFEIYLVILGVCGMFFCTFTIFRWMNVEPRFWKHLFAQDKGYYSILMLRDAVNVFTLFSSIQLFYKSILGMSQFQQNMTKDSNLGEGIGFVFWNGLGEWNFPVPNSIKQRYTWTLETDKSRFFDWGINASIEEERLKMNHMVNTAKLVLAIAFLTASVLKLSYFSVLHTYLRAMTIFTTMQDSSPPNSRGGASMASVVSEYVSDSAFHMNPMKTKSPPSKTEVIKPQKAA
ncbi:uncharacterized protein LOC110843442 [Folsomia candida]|uniref:uncharacterized protein LOC110843442 n=1 Tax=Folsomia candida TaxID=158441 RepID=UPI001604FDD3|nr:uncharacterized protein LOC110843442 [Folsomia candida]